MAPARPSRPPSVRQTLSNGNIPTYSAQHILADKIRLKYDRDLIYQVGIVELLDEDDRLAFVTYLGENVENSNVDHVSYQIVFANKSLRKESSILEDISNPVTKDSTDTPKGRASSEFVNWATDLSKTCPKQFFFAGVLWKRTALRTVLRVFTAELISGQAAPTPSAGSISSRSRNIEKSGFTSGVDQGKEAFRVDSRASTASKSRHTRGFSVGTPKKNVKAATSSAELTKPPEFHHPPTTFNTSLSSHPRAIKAPVIPSNTVEIFDWTRLPDSPNLDEHIRFFKHVDWACTPLGPMETWSSDLRINCNTLMASPFPAAMYWGRELTVIYNKAYIMIAGPKHPNLMGRPYGEAWSEVWDQVEGAFRRAFIACESTRKEDNQLFLYRRMEGGGLEETFFDWALIPIIGNDGSVVGVSNPAFEKTPH